MAAVGFAKKEQRKRKYSAEKHNHLYPEWK